MNELDNTNYILQKRFQLFLIKNKAMSQQKVKLQVSVKIFCFGHQPSPRINLPYWCTIHFKIFSSLIFTINVFQNVSLQSKEKSTDTTHTHTHTH